MKNLLLIMIMCVVFIPPINLGGIPLRVEDLFILIMMLYLLSGKYINLNQNFVSIIKVFVIFIIVSLLGLIFVIFEGYNPSLQDFNTLFLYCKSCLFLYVGYLLGQQLYKKSLNHLLLGFSLPLFLSSGLGLVQYFNILGLGETTFLLYGKERQIQYGISRAIGAFNNPNYASYFHAIGFILALNIQTNSKIFKVFRYIILTVCFFGVVLTFSRTGIIGLILTWFVCLILQQGYKHIFALVMSVVIVALYYLDELLQGTRLSKLAEQGDNSFGFSNFGDRTNLIWNKRFERFYENPLLGSGPGKNRASDTVFSTTIYDNSFLLLIITTGLLGLILYLVLYYRLLKPYIKLSNSYSKRSVRSSMVAIYLLTFIFFLTSDLIWNIHFVSYFYLLSGIFLNFIFSKTIKS